MNSYVIGGIIIWLLLGAIAVWREYHGLLKSWYNMFGESPLKNDYTSHMKFFIRCIPYFVLAGPITLYLFEKEGEGCWWFTTKGKSNKMNNN